MKIRQVGLEYLDEIRNITEKTFIETFGKENTEEDIESYIKENVSREKVRQELMNPASLFYIVERNDRIVAYMKLNLEGAQTEEGYSNSLEIQRIYVLNDFKRKRIGRRLMDKAIEEAGSRQVDFVWLGVWENNTKAIAFYEKHGFTIFDKHVFKLGDDEQTDYLMKRPI